jgi:hypothetical protein
MKRTFWGLAAVATMILAGCGGNPAGSSTSTSGSTGTSANAGSSGTTGTGSTSGSNASTGSTGTTGPWSEFDHSPFPIVPNVSNGPTLNRTQLVVITFDGYAYRSDMESFADWLVGSSWLTAVGADYGVGAGEVYQKVHLSTPAPSTISDSQIQSDLAAMIDDGTLPFPAGATPLPGTLSIPLTDAGTVDDAGSPDLDAGSLDDAGIPDVDAGTVDDAGIPVVDAGSPQTDAGEPLTEPLYTIYYPESTTIKLDQNDVSCSSFGGYHSYFTYRGVKVSYAVLPTCDSGGFTEP